MKRVLTWVFLSLFLTLPVISWAAKPGHPSEISLGQWRVCKAGIDCKTPYYYVHFTTPNAGKIVHPLHGEGNFVGEWKSWNLWATAHFPSGDRPVIFFFHYKADRDLPNFYIKLFDRAFGGTFKHGYGTEICTKPCQ